MRRLLPVIALLGACSSSPILIPERSALNDDLVSAMRVWNGSGLADYRYELQIKSAHACLLPRLEITVRRHLVKSIRYGEDWVDCSSHERRYKGRSAEARFSAYESTIGDLLVQIVGALQSPYGGFAYFHPEFGFPVTFQLIDPRFAKHDYEYTITRFEIL